jgi:hypothetical protein
LWRIMKRRGSSRLGSSSASRPQRGGTRKWEPRRASARRGRKRDVATIGCLSIIWRKIALACARCRRCRRRWSWRPPRRGLRKRTSDRGPCLFQWVETDHGRPRPLALCAHGDGLNFSCASYIDTSSRVLLVVRSYRSNPAPGVRATNHLD